MRIVAASSEEFQSKIDVLLVHLEDFWDLKELSRSFDFLRDLGFIVFGFIFYFVYVFYLIVRLAFYIKK